MGSRGTRSLASVLLLMTVIIWAWGAQVAVATLPVAGNAHAKTLDMRPVTGAPLSFTLPVKARDTAPEPRITSGSTTVTLLSDGFENGLSWQTYHFGDAMYYSTTWGISSYRAGSGTYSAYCAQNDNPNAPNHVYPNGMDGYMYRGPFNLTNATSASLGFDTWFDSEYNYDWVSIYYSLNGTIFHEINGWSGVSSGWERKVSDVSNLCGQPQVWIAFAFYSDANHAYEGAYVDNVNLSATVSLPGPTIIGFAPASGSVGSSVTLTGSGLSGASAVRFNGVAASFTPFSDTQLNCTVPPGASSGPISVTTSAGTARSAASFIVMQAGPHISTLSPGSGKRGATVTITGSGFGAVLGSGSVRFGARSCSLYLSWRNTRITCKVPAKAAFGRLSVAVRSSSGVSNAVGFTVKR